LGEVKTLKKQTGHKRALGRTGVSAEDLLVTARTIGRATVVIEPLEDISPEEMRQLIDALRRKREKCLAVLLATASEGKVQLAAGLSRDLVERGMHAGNWLKEVAPLVGGGGGGRPDLAQAGGKSPEQIPAALERALESIRSQLEAE